MLSERFPALGLSDGAEPGAAVRALLAYVARLARDGDAGELGRVFDTIESIVLHASYDVQDVTIVELVEAIDDDALTAHFRPATRKWWNYHRLQRDAAHGD